MWREIADIMIKKLPTKKSASDSSANNSNRWKNGYLKYTINDKKKYINIATTIFIYKVVVQYTK